MRSHEVSAVREPIGITEKRQQYFDRCEYQLNMPFVQMDGTNRSIVPNFRWLFISSFHFVGDGVGDTRRAIDLRRAFSKNIAELYISVNRSRPEDCGPISWCTLSPNRISRSDRGVRRLLAPIDLPDRKIPISRRYDNLAPASFLCLISVQYRCHRISISLGIVTQNA